MLVGYIFAFMEHIKDRDMFTIFWNEIIVIAINYEDG